MASLSAFYSGQDGKQINVAENGDKVNVVFTDPADTARDVEVSVIEVDDPDKPGSEKNGERTIMVVRGDFMKKKFYPNNYHIVSQVSADPKRAVTISIAVGEGASWATELPQDRPEGGRFDLRLDIKNPADGKTRKGVALLHVYYKMDIMIIPKTAGVHQKGLASWRVWAREQWKKRAPATRDEVEMPLDPRRFADPVTAQDLAAFVKAMTTAVEKAHGGAVGIAVGHGGGALDDHGVQKDPWLNLVPEDRTGGVPRDHFRMMVDQPVLTDATLGAFLSSNNFAIVTAMDQVRAAIKASKPVEEVRLLTCNVGKVDPMGRLTPMTQLMADRLGMPVRGYTDYIYISDPKDRPIYVGKQTDVSEEAKREWPTYLSPLASPGAAPPAPVRTP